MALCSIVEMWKNVAGLEQGDLAVELQLAPSQWLAAGVPLLVHMTCHMLLSFGASTDEISYGRLSNFDDYMVCVCVLTWCVFMWCVCVYLVYVFMVCGFSWCLFLQTFMVRFFQILLDSDQAESDDTDEKVRYTISITDVSHLWIDWLIDWLIVDVVT